MTGSEQTDRLIRMALQVAAQETEPAAFEVYLQARREGLIRAREDLEARAREREEDFLTRVEPEYAAVQAGFSAYEEALLQLHTGDLSGGARALQEVTPHLLAALEVYGQRFMNLGASRFPLLNAMTNLSRALARQDIDAARLAEAVGKARQPYAAEFEQLADGPLKTAVEKLLEALSVPLDLDRLHEACLAQAQIREQLIEDRLQAGPTASPAANLLLASLHSGALGEQCLSWYVDWFAHRRADFEGLLAHPASSSMVEEELPRTRDALDAHEEALARLSQDPTNTAGFITSVARLHRSFQVYEREGQLLCPGCSQVNAPTARICQACGRRLPRPADLRESTFSLSESSEPTTMVLTTNLLRLLEACQQVYDHRLDADGFNEVLDWAQGLLETADQELLDLGDEDDEVFQETRELFREGLAEFAQGLTAMAAYLPHREGRSLTAGIQAVWSGADKIRQCRRTSELADETT